MLGRLRRLRARRQRERTAVRRALRAFRSSRGTAPLTAHVLHMDARETVVRVAYMTDRVPPDRAWYVISEDDHSAREVAFGDVAHWETVWR